MINFDNTLQVKNQAKKLQHLLKVPQGTEKQKYNIGDIVKSTKYATYSIKGKIVEIYLENGYYRYVVKDDLGMVTMRQKDIEKV